eukprot:793582-Pyramimonas_sp.AAC.1
MQKAVSKGKRPNIPPKLGPWRSPGGAARAWFGRLGGDFGGPASREAVWARSGPKLRVLTCRHPPNLRPQ